MRWCLLYTNPIETHNRLVTKLILRVPYQKGQSYVPNVLFSPQQHHQVRIRGYIQKFPDWINNEIYAYNNKHSFRSNTKGYGSKTHQADSQNSDTTAPSGRELYHLQFSLQAASPETSGYTLVRHYFPSPPFGFDAGDVKTRACAVTYTSYVTNTLSHVKSKF
jgi:hypothetical protein